MSYRDWYVGMKVVCVNDTFDERRPLAAVAQELIPTQGYIYTVREIGILLPWKRPEVCVRLVEIINPIKLYRSPDLKFNRYERCFLASRFRPVQARATDISIFTSMLSPERGKVEA